MGYLVYTPSRSLIGGSDGKLTPEFSKFQAAHKDSISQKKSLDKSNMESNYYGREKFYQVKTDFVDLSSQPKWEEFWHSVAGGETFSIDALGSEASPDNLLSVTMVPNSWKIQPLGGRIQSYSFKVRVN